MRGSKAKALRNMARRVSQGAPDRQWLGQKHKNGNTTAINDPASTRGIYRQWKKISRPGRRVFADQEKNNG